MSAIRRAAWAAAAVLMLALATTAFAPPVARPPAPRPPAPRPVTPPGGGIAGRPGGNVGGIRPNLPPPGGGMWGRNPTQVHGEIRSTIASKPSQAFTRLAGQDGHVLGDAAKLALAREAVVRVAVLAETGKHPVASLSEVRLTQTAAKEMPAETRASLKRISEGAERRVLAAAIEAVRSRASAKQWAEMERAATDWLTQLNDGRLNLHREFESPEFRVRLGEVRDGLTQMQTHARRLEAVTAFESAVASKEANAFGKVDRANLTPKLARQLDCLRGSSELKALSSGKWTTSPDVASVKATIARFERGLIEVEGADVNLGKKLSQDLAVKALLDGHAEAALKLLPEGGSAEHAGNLLRDLKALALGEGKVETWPAKSSLPEAKAAPASPRPPPGLEPLIPEAAREGWRPPVKEKGPGLPPVEQAARVGDAIRTQTEPAIAAEKKSAEAKVGETNAALTKLFERVMAPELAERKKLASIEAELDRRLKPAERVRARTLLAEQKTTKQVVDDLVAQPATDDEENEFLADVEKRLGVPLDETQRTQAKRLRKQKRTAAEVADILRR